MYPKKTTDTSLHKFRRTYTEDFKRKTVDEFYASKMTLTVFSKQASIEYTVIWKWIMKYGKNSANLSDKPATPDEFIMLKHEIFEIKATLEMLKKIVSKSFQDKYK